MLAITSQSAVSPPNGIAKFLVKRKLTFDDLPDDCVRMLFDLLVGATISDHVKDGYKLTSGIRALVRFISASRRAWLLEKTHQYKVVATFHGHAPEKWFLSRRGRIRQVAYDSFRISDLSIHADMNMFSACGALVDITTNYDEFMLSRGNIIKATVTLDHLCWNGPAISGFAKMMKINRDCHLTIRTPLRCKHYKGCEILRRADQLQALVPFKDRLDMSGMDILTRTKSMRRYVCFNFPDADVHHASAHWNTDDYESTITEDGGSEAEADSDYEENLVQEEHENGGNSDSLEEEIEDDDEGELEDNVL